MAVSKKRGACIAIAGLAVLLVAAAIAYAVLFPQRASLATGEGGAAASGAETTLVSTATEPTHATGDPAELDVGSKLSDYNSTVHTEDGILVYLSDIAAGRPLVVHFWASWCLFCMTELPDYQAVYNEYGDKVSFAFVDTFGREGETVEGSIAAMEEGGYDLPLYFDTDVTAQEDYGGVGLPLTFVYDAEGTLVYQKIGALAPEEFLPLLDSLA